MEAQVALLGAFSLSALLGLVSHLLLDNTHRFSMGFRSGEFDWPIKHSGTMVIKPGTGTSGSVSCWKMKSESLHLIRIRNKTFSDSDIACVSGRKHEVL